MGPEFDVCAIDLCPSSPSVLRCDFLTCSIETIEGVRRTTYLDEDGTCLPAIEALPRSGFDVAVVSLVLSYLPNATLRETMIDRARDCLVWSETSDPGKAGLLLVVERASISRAVRKGGRPGDGVLRGWVDAIEDRGFELISYDFIECGGSAHALAFQTTALKKPRNTRLLASMRTRKEEASGSMAVKGPA
eukprot:CAMPEP_0172631114 /NCGR_PEP_ID=MMETSP1068-20121228/177314_1 /TAXON_ID=35684 /ORGANISM="Pseudopedinella elastica, Strain CCMP716" /LENGTH=190 /DNA_ID=CAMNT_0013442153 /DNA_START=114 /DNA_END=686 /DNA_ORIENTATION=+